MITLILSKTGFGKCVNDNGTTFKVLKTKDGLYNLAIGRKGEFEFWAKEDVKRLSTIQKYLDSHNYNVKVEEETA